MRCTGQTSTHARSFTSMHASVMIASPAISTPYTRCCVRARLTRARLRMKSAQLLELFDQLAHRPIRETCHRAVCVADRSLTVDDEHTAPREAERTERAVCPRDRLVRVREQRECETVLAGECLVAVDRLRRDADDLRVELLEFLEAVVVRVELLGAHRRVVARIEDEHQRPAAEVCQRVRSATRAWQREVRSLVADADAHGSTVRSCREPTSIIRPPPP